MKQMTDTDVRPSVEGASSTVAASPPDSTAPSSLPELVDQLGSVVDELLALADRHLGPSDRPAEALLGLTGLSDRLAASVVGLAGHGGTAADAVSREQMTVEQLLTTYARQTGGDRRMLLMAAETLPSLPCTRMLFARGTISWGEVRRIVAAAARRSLAERERIDQAIADHPNLSDLDADAVLQALDAIEAELDGPQQDARDEQAAHQRRYLTMQPRLDGSGGTGFFDLDGDGFETVATALDACAGPPDQVDVQGLNPWQATAARARGRGRQRADALVDITRTWLSGTPADDPDTPDTADGDDAHNRDTSTSQGRPARPARATVNVLVNLQDLKDGCAHAWGLWRTGRRGPIRLTRTGFDRLACDADVRVILMDGAVPLGVADRHRQIPDTLRIALNIRDRHCRWPGCRQPVHHCDAHHLTGWNTGQAQTELEELILLCRTHHVQAHHGWTITLHSDATATFVRGRRRRTTLPGGTEHLDLPPPPDSPDPPGDPPGTRPPSPGTDPPRGPPADPELPF